MRENKRTELNLTVFTDYEHPENDCLERVRQEIEQAGFHLQTIFNLIKRSALHVEHLFIEDENDTVKSFCYDLIHSSDIGNGLAMTIWKSISDLSELQMKDETPEVVDAESETRQQPNSETIAEKISFLITSENVPVEISEAIQNALTDIQNANKQESVLELEKSPDYIARILRDYRQSEAKND